MPQAILTTCFCLLGFSHLHFGRWSLLLAAEHLLCPFWSFVFSSYLAIWTLWPFFTSGEVAHGLIQLSFGYLQGGDFTASRGSPLQGLIVFFVRYLACFSVFPFWAFLGKELGDLKLTEHWYSVLFQWGTHLTFRRPFWSSLGLADVTQGMGETCTF